VIPFHNSGGVTIHCGDALAVLTELPSASVACCVTSPPYFQLRDYSHDDQIGQEETPSAYVDALVGVFGEVRRALADDGTLWLNLGDTYFGGGPGGASPIQDSNLGSFVKTKPRPIGFKNKDIGGIPWRVAFALQADGWYLRQDIIWAKPNPMPESVTDRCTKSHEYVFLLSKSPSYHFDHEAIAEPTTYGIYKDAGGYNGKNKRSGGACFGKVSCEDESNDAGQQARRYDRPVYERRRPRSVWTIPTKSYHGAHFAVMPEALATRCIKAGCKPGGTVLDPFGGAGTTALAARNLGHPCVLIELNEKFCGLAVERLSQGVLGFTEAIA
jgi:DNA modification methylase